MTLTLLASLEPPVKERAGPVKKSNGMRSSALAWYIIVSA
jgi:hypothetical protein